MLKGRSRRKQRPQYSFLLSLRRNVVVHSGGKSPKQYGLENRSCSHDTIAFCDSFIPGSSVSTYTSVLKAMSCIIAF